MPTRQHRAASEHRTPILNILEHTKLQANVLQLPTNASLAVQELKDLVKRLLTHSPTQRLGSLKGGAMDVKSHPWFAEFDWNAFENQTMPAPYIPKVVLCS